MKFNIAFPAHGTMYMDDIEDEGVLRAFYDKRISQEVDGDVMGEKYAGYRFRITGGNDKQGFPMIQGLLINKRAKLLLKAGSKAYRPRRKGERKKKSVRGCIVGPDIRVLNLVVVQKGPGEIEGLTTENIPRRVGPKRASNIRKFWGLLKTEDVRKFVIARTFTTKKGKEVTKRPKIQRLVTPVQRQRKRARAVAKVQNRERVKRDAQEYARMLTQRATERAAARRSSRRSSRRE